MWYRPLDSIRQDVPPLNYDIVLDVHDSKDCVLRMTLYPFSSVRFDLKPEVAGPASSASQPKPASLLYNALRGLGEIHKTRFGAIAELIDNAKDANARNLRIDWSNLGGGINGLFFRDDGTGMSMEVLKRMLQELGYTWNKQRSDIGGWGYGFKSGVLKLARDALVISSVNGEQFSVGLFSYPPDKDNSTDPVVIYAYSCSAIGEPVSAEDTAQRQRMEKICSDQKVKLGDVVQSELQKFKKSSGTAILVYNLKDGLTFTADDIKIKFGGEGSFDVLREYCRWLYLMPKLQLHLNGTKVGIGVAAARLDNMVKTDVDICDAQGNLR